MAKKERKLDLFKKVLPAIDRKDRDFYDNLTDEERKEFSAVVIERFASTLDPPRWEKDRGVEYSPDLVAYYIQSVNHYVNKNLYDIPTTKDNDHRKLLWLLLTATSPNMGAYGRAWIPLKKEPTDPKFKKLLELFPDKKPEDLEVLSKLITKKELDQYVKDLGE